MSLEANRVYRVSFDFEAEGEGELSVSEGWLVTVLQRDDGNDGDGWEKVSLVNNSDVIGFVPGEYLEAVDRESEDKKGGGDEALDVGGEEEKLGGGGDIGAFAPTVGGGESGSGGGRGVGEAVKASTAATSPPTPPKPSVIPTTTSSSSPPSSSPPSSSSAPLFTPSTSYHPPSSSSSSSSTIPHPPSATPAAAHSTPMSSALALAESSGSGFGAVGSGLSPAATTAAMQSDEFAHLFETHEEWFRAAMAKRNETFRGLQQQVADVSKRLVDAEAKGTAVVRNLAELEDIISKERDKWVARLDRERAEIDAESRAAQPPALTDRIA